MKHRYGTTLLWYMQYWLWRKNLIASFTLGYVWQKFLSKITLFFKKMICKVRSINNKTDALVLSYNSHGVPTA